MRIRGQEEVEPQAIWLKEQKKWSGGVEHIHRGDAAVGEILLGEEHWIAIRIGYELVRGQVCR